MTKNTNAYRTFNRWLIFAGILLFATYLTYHYGLLEALLTNDSSHLSLVILIFFGAASLHVGWLAHRLGFQAEQTHALIQGTATQSAFFEQHDAQIKIQGTQAPDSMAAEHLVFLAEKYRAFGHVTEQDLLLDRLDHRLRAGHETGWFIADLMVRLGLLGTVIGFIFMLGSITTITTVDLQALQQLLGNMSGGMQVALYTTLAGLSTGILLSFQYQLLDQGADRLLSDIIELSEVHAIAHLRDFARNPTA